MKMKMCCGCRQALTPDNFGVDRSRPDELNVYCKACKRDYENAAARIRRRVKMHQRKLEQKEYSIREVADVLCVDYEWVYRKVNAKRIPAAAAPGRRDAKRITLKGLAVAERLLLKEERRYA